MLKKTIRDSGFSVLSIIVMNLIFIFLTIYAGMLRPFHGVITFVIFSGLLYLGYFIGGKFFIINPASIISVTVLPLLVIALLYVVSLYTMPFLEKALGIPSAIWGEAINYRTYNNLIIYTCLFFHYFLFALSLFIGAYRKSKITSA